MRTHVWRGLTWCRMAKPRQRLGLVLKEPTIYIQSNWTVIPRKEGHTEKFYFHHCHASMSVTGLM